MSKSLDLVRVLLRQAQHCHDLGIRHEAKHRFERLAGFRSLPPDVAEETQVRLSELCRDEDDPFQERQHLACALGQQPNNPEYHFRMAQAYLSDDGAPDEKALPHLCAAVRIDPENSRYLAALGGLSVRLGETSQGLRLLKKAYDFADGDVDILEQFAAALMDAGHADDARDLLKAAMFRHCRDRRFRDLYRDFQFRAVADEQSAKASLPFPGDAPVILRFALAKVKKRRTNVNGQIFRIDGAEPLAGPSRRSPSRKRQTP